MADQNAKIDENNRNSLLGQDESSGELRRLQTDANGVLKVVIDSFTASFLDLSDTPSSYSGQAGNAVIVNGTEDGLIFQAIAAGGDVTGPASATDNAIARFDTTTGKLIQNSSVTVDDSGNIAGAGTINTKTLPTGDFVGTTDTQTLTNKDLTNATNTFPSASTTASGDVELATAGETTTGTDSTRAVTPDGLAGSDYGIRLVSVQLVAGGTDVAVGDGAGNARFFVPSQLNGWNLVSVAAAVITAGTTNTTDIQIHNVTQTADMLSTKITIDSTEKTSYTAATAPVIDTANDDVATGDELRFDVDAVSTTAPQGLIVILGFQLP